jgi:hypothetical protein
MISSGFLLSQPKHGLYNHTKIAIIPCDQLKDFVQGEENYPKFRCKFTRTKEHKIWNPLNTLMHPKENFEALVYRCYFIFKVIFFQSNALFYICLVPFIVSFTSKF